MAILLKNGAVFLHIPKTGGCFVQDALRRLDLVQRCAGDHNDHDRVFWYDRFHHDDKVLRNLFRRAIGVIPSIPRSPFRFCFVREPLSWYVSFWRYMESLNWRFLGDEDNPYHWNPLAMLNGLGNCEFNEFVYNVNRKRPGYVTEMYGWYARPSTDFVGRTEDLVADLRKVLALMDVDVQDGFFEKLAPLNQVSHVPLPEWDPDLRRKTLQLEYIGYVRYGYDVDCARQEEPAWSDSSHANGPLGVEAETCLSP